MFLREIQGLSCTQLFPSSAQLSGSLTLLGEASLLCQGGPERQVREGAPGIITKQHQVVYGTGWTPGSTWPLLPPPPGTPHLGPQSWLPQSSGLLSPLPPGLCPVPLTRSPPHLVLQVITPGDFLASRNLVAHLPPAGLATPPLVSWSGIPPKGVANHSRYEPWEALGFRVKGGLGKFLKTMPRGRTGLALQWGRSRGKGAWGWMGGVIFPRTGQAGAPQCSSPLQSEVRSLGTGACALGSKVTSLVLALS